MTLRRKSLIDELIGSIDSAVRVGFPSQAVGQTVGQEPGAANSEAAQMQDEEGLSESERARSAALMRVNHAGEVCAQALYRGQAITARAPELQAQMLEAASEEGAHLQWCRQRLHELGEQPSRLDPLWYLGSYLTGIVAGAAGDRWNLGFLAETERQVVEHLEGHLRQLPERDLTSRAIVIRMQQDEAAHEARAVESGAAQLPGVLKALMRVQAKLMTVLAYRF
jgi:ubiquinone biosynthesis monooxygenase Coq7